MARKKSSVDLPALPKAPRFSSGANATAQVRTIVRGFAEAHREEAPRAFYSLRTVADHFRVPLSTARQVFQSLSREGLLVQLRGSQTVLQGRSADRNLTVRGVIGVAARTSQFAWSLDYQSFALHVRRQLRRRGLISALAYYEPKADADTLVERLQQTRADTVLWYLPDRLARDTAAQLGDLGIRTIAVSDGAMPSIPCRYAIEREQAIRTIMRDWQASGVKSARIAQAEGQPTFGADRASDVCEELGVETVRATISSDGVEQFVTACIESAAQGVVLLGAAAALCHMRAPQLLQRLLVRCRVALVDGPVAAPLTERLTGPADLVLVEWQAVAKELADDLAMGAVMDGSDQVRFHAAAQLRSNLQNLDEKVLRAA